MRRAALLALLMAFLAASDARAAAPCGPAGARTMAAGSVSRVYVQSEDVFACTRGVRRRLPLGTTYCYGSSTGCATLDHAAVAGRVVAYGINRYGGGSGITAFELFVRDVRSGRRLERQVEGFGTVDAQLEGIVVRPTGAAAWLWRRGSGDVPAERVVSRSDRCGAPTTLAHGAALARSTLWRNGARVFWRQGGMDQFAPLC
jgi:hypothetical protein